MRIAHLTPTYFSPDSVVGGGERHVHNLCQAIRGAVGWPQTIFVVAAAEKRFSRDGVAVHLLPNESPLPGAMNGLSARLWDVLPGFDLVHIHQVLTTFGAHATAIVRSLGIPAVGTDLGGGEDMLMLRGHGLRLLSGMLSISRYAHDRIAVFYDGPHEVLVGPVDTDRFRPQPGAVRDGRTVLCVGRILPHKGVDRVIAALPDGLRLIVVGQIYDAGYHRLLQEMARGKDVHFRHDVDDDGLRQLYCTAALLVQASTFRDVYGNGVAKPELMGLTALEAMACGLPVAVSDAGSLPELVPDPRFGRVFSRPEELASILRELREGTWPTAVAATAARQHVVTRHGMAAIGGRLAAFYRTVSAEAETRRCAS